jgi:hypothetical protein
MPQEEVDTAMTNIENKKNRIKGLIEESIQQLEEALQTSSGDDLELMEFMIKDAREKLELLNQ